MLFLGGIRREKCILRKRDGEDLNLEDDDYTSRKLKESDSESVEKLAKGLSNFVSDLCNKIWNLEEKRREEVIYTTNNRRYLVIPYFQYCYLQNVGAFFIFLIGTIYHGENFLIIDK